MRTRTRSALRAIAFSATAACFLGLGGSAMAQAQSQTSPPGASRVAPAANSTGAPVPHDDSLFLALGGEDGIHRFINDLVDRAIHDPRIAHQFEHTKPQGLKDSLAEQVCAISGGPCPYRGAKMKPAHADMGITKAEFLSLVEDLQDAMAADGVPFSAQNRLLALLAPMHRDIIEQPRTQP